MQSEMQQNITQFIYHLGNENYAKADSYLKTIVDDKQEARYDAAYAKVSSSSLKESRKSKPSRN